MRVYAFDYESRAYLGERELGIGDLDPRSPGVVLVPGDCTVVPPPRCTENLWPFWIDGAWVVYESVLVMPDETLAECAALVGFIKWKRAVKEKQECRAAQS